MKKTIKVLGKVVKWYTIFNTACLAFIGAGQVFKEVDEDPSRPVMQVIDSVWDKALENWKMFIGWWKA